MINIEEMINDSVNDSRGGYRPDEVKTLMWKAYKSGVENARESISTAVNETAVMPR